MRSQRALVTDWNWRSFEWHKYTLFRYGYTSRISVLVESPTSTVLSVIQSNEELCNALQGKKGTQQQLNCTKICRIYFDILAFTCQYTNEKRKKHTIIHRMRHGKVFVKFLISIFYVWCCFLFSDSKKNFCK